MISDSELKLTALNLKLRLAAIGVQVELIGEAVKAYSSDEAIPRLSRCASPHASGQYCLVVRKEI